MSKNKKKKWSLPSLRSVFLVYSVLASTLALGGFLTFVSAYQNQMKYVGESDFKQLVRDTQLSMYSAPEFNYTDSRLYFPEMNISIPSSSDTRQLLYEYQTAIDEPDITVPASASFGSKSAIYNTSKGIDKLVCSRLADVTFNHQDADRGGENFPPVAEVKLGDGRMMYIYQNNTPGCVSVWTGLDSTEIVELLKQATSH